MATLISGSTGVDKIQDGTITNADINASAAIAGTKLVMPAGSVIQVVNGTTYANASIGGASFVDTNLTATITPTSTSSKILVFVTQPFTFTTATSTTRDTRTQLLRGSTVISSGWQEWYIYIGSFTSTNFTWAVTKLDSPNTTSATTYKTQMYISGSTADLYAQKGSNTDSYITLMEIAV
jgi:hypothetical protein|tara:strand:+ start:28 stop:567 length:540 start_codon:yes stop_codon:yes gene_type:complete